MERLFDVTVSKTDKISGKDASGNWKSAEYGYGLTEHGVPGDEVRERTQELRVQVTKFICSSEALDGQKSPDKAMEEIRAAEELLTKWREKNGKAQGSEARSPEGAAAAGGV